MAIQSFADQTTSDVFHGINSKAARRIPRDVWSAAQRKMSALHAAKQTADLSLPGMHFEPLKHNKPGFNSIRVNDRYRIIFRFANGHAYDVALDNYHGRTQS